MISKITALFSLAIYTVIAFASFAANASSPEWWSQCAFRSQEPEDHEIACQGQAKYMAFMAAKILDQEFDYCGGAGSEIHALIKDFSTRHNHEVLLIGQLKALAAPYFHRLAELGVDVSALVEDSGYPWSQSTADDEDNAPALLGQLKHVFSFEAINRVDTDRDSIPDDWEREKLGGLVDPLGDHDNDGLTNYDEYIRGTDPSIADSDGDGCPDWLEIVLGRNPLLFEDFETPPFPYNESFETGFMEGDELPRYWTVDGGFSLVSDQDSFEGRRHLRISSSSKTGFRVACGFSLPSVPVVWVDYATIPERFSVGDHPALNALEPAAFHFDQLGRVVFFDPETSEWNTVTGVSMDASDSWQSITVRYDFVAQTWSLWLNGIGVVEHVRFSHPSPFFSVFQMRRSSEGSLALDNLSVSDRHDAAPSFDYDFDGLPDSWEIDNLGSLSFGANDDSDRDGLSNGAEYRQGTHPLKGDSDGDCVSDGVEIESGTNPLSALSFLVSFATDEGFQEGVIPHLWSSRMPVGSTVAKSPWNALSQSLLLDPSSGGSTVEFSSPLLIENTPDEGVLWYSISATFVPGPLADPGSMTEVPEACFQLDEDGYVVGWDGISQKWKRSSFKIDPLVARAHPFRFDVRISSHTSTWSLYQAGKEVLSDLGIAGQEYSDKNSCGLSFHFKGNWTDPLSKPLVYLDEVGLFDSKGSRDDKDGDEIPDLWEIHFFGSLAVADKTSDFDSDGIADRDEWLRGCNPLRADDQFSGVVVRVGNNEAESMAMEGMVLVDGKVDTGLLWASPSSGFDSNEKLPQLSGVFDGEDGNYDLFVGVLGFSGSHSYNLWVDGDYQNEFKDVAFSRHYSNQERLLLRRVSMGTKFLKKGDVIKVSCSDPHARIDSISIQPVDYSSVQYRAYVYAAHDSFQVGDYLQAESAAREGSLKVEQNPVSTDSKYPWSGGKVTNAKDGTWIRFDDVDLSGGVDTFDASASSAYGPNEVYLFVKIKSLDSEPVIRYLLINTSLGDINQAYHHGEQPLYKPLRYYSPQTVYVQFHSPKKDGELCHLDWVRFQKKGTDSINYIDKPQGTNKQPGSLIRLSDRSDCKGVSFDSNGEGTLDQAPAWIKFQSFNFGQSQSDYFQLVAHLEVNKWRIARLRLDSPTGPEVAAMSIVGRGKTATYSSYAPGLVSVSGSRDLYLVFEESGQLSQKVSSFSVGSSPRGNPLGIQSGVRADLLWRSSGITLVSVDEQVSTSVVESGDWLFWDRFDFGNQGWLKASAAYASSHGATLEFIVDASNPNDPGTGRVVGELVLPAQANLDFVELSFRAGQSESLLNAFRLSESVTGLHRLHVRFKDVKGDCRLIWVKFDGAEAPIAVQCTNFGVGEPFKAAVSCQSSGPVTMAPDSSRVSIRAGAQSVLHYSSFDFGDGGIDYLRIAASLPTKGSSVVAKVLVNDQDYGHMSMVWSGKDGGSVYGAYLSNLAQIKGEHDLKIVFDSANADFDVSTIELSGAPRATSMQAQSAGLHPSQLWAASGVTLVDNQAWLIDGSAGDWLFFSGVDFGDSEWLKARLSLYGKTGGMVEIYATTPQGNPTEYAFPSGDKIGEIQVSSSNSVWYETTNTKLINSVKGIKDVFVRFVGSSLTCRMDWILFETCEPPRDYYCSSHKAGVPFRASKYCAIDGPVVPIQPDGLVFDENSGFSHDEVCLKVFGDGASVTFSGVDFGNGGYDYFEIGGLAKDSNRARATLYHRPEGTADWHYLGTLVMFRVDSSDAAVYGASLVAGNPVGLNGMHDIKVEFPEVPGEVRVDTIHISKARRTPNLNALDGFSVPNFWRSRGDTISNDRAWELEDGDWFFFEGVSFDSLEGAIIPWLKAAAAYACKSGEGQLEFYLAETPDREPLASEFLASIPIRGTGNWEFKESRDIEAKAVRKVSGSHNLYVRYTGLGLVNLYWVDFDATDVPREVASKEHKAGDSSFRAYEFTSVDGMVCATNESIESKRKLRVSGGGSVTYESFYLDYESFHLDDKETDYVEWSCSLSPSSRGIAKFYFGNSPVGGMSWSHPTGTTESSHTFGAHIPLLGKFKDPTVQEGALRIVFENVSGDMVIERIRIGSHSESSLASGGRVGVNRIDRSSGVTLIDDSFVFFGEAGDWVSFGDYVFPEGQPLVSANYASKTGGLMNFYVGPSDPWNPHSGILLGSQRLPGNENWAMTETKTPTLLSGSVSAGNNTMRLYSVFASPPGSTGNAEIVRLESLEFTPLIPDSKRRLLHDFKYSLSKKDNVIYWSDRVSVETGTRFVSVCNGGYVVLPGFDPVSRIPEKVEAAIRLRQGHTAVVCCYLTGPDNIDRYIGGFSVIPSSDANQTYTYSGSLSGLTESSDLWISQRSLKITFQVFGDQANNEQSPPMEVDYVYFRSSESQRMKINDDIPAHRFNHAGGVSGMYLRDPNSWAYVKDTGRIVAVDDVDGRGMDYISFRGFDYGQSGGALGVRFVYACGNSEGVHVRLHHGDSPYVYSAETLLGEVGLGSTGGWDTYVESDVMLLNQNRGLTGPANLFLNFLSPGNSKDELVRIRSMKIVELDRGSCKDKKATNTIRAVDACLVNDSVNAFSFLDDHVLLQLPPSTTAGDRIGMVKFEQIDFESGVDFFELGGVLLGEGGGYIDVVLSDSDHPLDAPGVDWNAIPVYGRIVIPGQHLITDTDKTADVSFGGSINFIPEGIHHDLYLVAYSLNSRPSDAGIDPCFEWKWLRFSKRGGVSSSRLDERLEAESFSIGHDVQTFTKGERGSVVHIDGQKSAEENDYIRFSNFDFGRENRVSVSGCYASGLNQQTQLVFHAFMGDPEPIELGSVLLPAANSWHVWNEFSNLELSYDGSRVFGQGDLRVSFVPQSGSTSDELLRLDWLKLDRASQWNPDQYGLEMTVDAWNNSEQSAHAFGKSNTPSGKQCLSNVLNGSWIKFDSFDFGRNEARFISVSMEATGQSGPVGGKIHIYSGASMVGSTRIGTLHVPAVNGWHDLVTGLDMSSLGSVAANRQDILYLKFESNSLAKWKIESFSLSSVGPVVSPHFVMPESSESISIGRLHGMVLMDNQTIVSVQKDGWMRLDGFNLLSGQSYVSTVNYLTGSSGDAFMRIGVGDPAMRDQFQAGSPYRGTYWKSFSLVRTNGAPINLEEGLAPLVPNDAGKRDIYVDFALSGNLPVPFSLNAFSLSSQTCTRYGLGDTVDATKFCFGTDVQVDTDQNGSYVSRIEHLDYLCFLDYSFQSGNGVFASVNARVNEESKAGCHVDIYADINGDRMWDDSELLGTLTVPPSGATDRFVSYGTSINTSGLGSTTYDLYFVFRSLKSDSSEPLPDVKGFLLDQGGCSAGSLGLGSKVFPDMLCGSAGVILVSDKDSPFSGTNKLVGIEHNDWIRFNSFKFEGYERGVPASLSVRYSTNNSTWGGQLFLYAVVPGQTTALPWDSGIEPFAQIALPQGSVSGVQQAILPLNQGASGFLPDPRTYDLYLRFVHEKLIQDPSAIQYKENQLFEFNSFSIQLDGLSDCFSLCNKRTGKYAELRGGRYPDFGGLYSEDSPVIQQTSSYDRRSHQLWHSDSLGVDSLGNEIVRLRIDNPGGISRYIGTVGQSLSSGSKLVLTSNPDAAIQWVLEDVEGGVVIRVAGLMLVAQAPFSSDHDLDGVPIVLGEYVSGPGNPTARSHQIWFRQAEIREDSVGSFTHLQHLFVRKDFSSKAMGVDFPIPGETVWGEVRDSSLWQSWFVAPVFNDPGFYSLSIHDRSAGTSSILLADDEQRLKLGQDNGVLAPNMKWKIAPVGDGFFKFAPGHACDPINEHSLAVLPTGSGFLSPWEGVIAPSDPANFSQHFYLQDQTFSGRYVLHNAKSGRVIAVKETGADGPLTLSLVESTTEEAVPGSEFHLNATGLGFHCIAVEGEGDPFPLVLSRQPGSALNGSSVFVDEIGKEYRFHWDIVPVSLKSDTVLYKIVARGVSGEKVLAPAPNGSDTLVILDYDPSDEAHLWALTSSGVTLGGFVPMGGFDDNDWDGDGMPNEWEILHGINPWVNDAYLDKDGDSYPNIYEYVWDTNPSDPTSMPSVAVSVGPGSPVNSIQQAFDMAKHDYLIIKLVPGHVYEGQGNENVSINPVARNFLILCSGATANSVSVAHGFFNHRTGASGFIKNSERIIGSIVRNSPQRYQPSSSPNTPGTH